MCTYFNTKTDVAQNLIDDFFSNFDFHRKSGGTELVSEKRKQPPVVIQEQAILYSIFILCLCQKIIGTSDQDVQFMNFPSKIFSNDINHGYRAAILKKNSLWLLPFYTLWLLISIMKRCAERCAQQLYQTSLKYSVVSLDSTSSQEFIVVQSTLLGCFTVTFHLYIHSILVNPFPFWLW